MKTWTTTTMSKTVTFRGSSFIDALEFFRDTERDFTVERTGYTAKLTTGDGRKYLFTDSPIRPSLFPLTRRMRDEVKAAGVPVIEEKQVEYFSFRNAMKRKDLPRVAWSIDLSSAYAYALHGRRLVTDATFTELLALPKDERLRVVGMLATTKAVIRYEGGKVAALDTFKSETRGAFFACCEDVGAIMKDVEGAPGHLFFWVDGAFFDRPAPEVVDYFEAQGFPAKTEKVTDLKWSDSRRFLFFTKDGKRKYLSVPREKQPSAAWIAELLGKQPTTSNQ